MRDESELVEIGELARRADTSASAIRYYEELGLIAPDERRGGRRRYSAAAAERVALVRLCQEVGFKLSEIREVSNLRRRSRRWSELVEQRIRDLDEQIAAAQRAKELLQHGLDCPHPNMWDCPKFRAGLQSRLVD